jgi:methylmalonyl-CoA decarboxylase
MSFSFLKAELSENIATIRFSNYASRNALSKSLINEFLMALQDFSTQDVRVLIIRTDQKNKVWSSGHDITELPQACRDPLPADDPIELLLAAIRSFRAPVIAMVDGQVWGASCDLIMCCDMVYGDDDSTFAITPAKLGLPYTASGISHFMSRLPLNLVNEMFCSALPISATRAANIGILNELVSAGNLEERVLEMARVIATRSPQAIAAFKAQAQLLADAYSLTPTAYERLQSIRRNVYLGSDYQEGIDAFLQKRTPVFKTPDSNL